MKKKNKSMTKTYTDNDTTLKHEDTERSRIWPGDSILQENDNKYVKRRNSGWKENSKTTKYA